MRPEPIKSQDTGSSFVGPLGTELSRLHGRILTSAYKPLHCLLYKWVERETRDSGSELDRRVCVGQ